MRIHYNQNLYQPTRSQLSIGLLSLCLLRLLREKERALSLLKREGEDLSVRQPILGSGGDRPVPFAASETVTPLAS